jgi:(p)ppGpp synthase/HD superfamily hydrolase
MDKELYEKIKAFATKHHEGIFREDGKPYITHPEGVDEIVTDWFENGYYLKWFIGKDMHYSPLADYDRRQLLYMLKALAIAHDTIEDKNAKGKNISVYDYEDMFFSHGDYMIFRDALSALTRGHNYKEETYLQFILRAKENPYARYVKLADLAHNLLDSKPGSRKDKYQLSQHILTQ